MAGKAQLQLLIPTIDILFHNKAFNLVGLLLKIKVDFKLVVAT